MQKSNKSYTFLRLAQSPDMNYARFGKGMVPTCFNRGQRQEFKQLNLHRMGTPRPCSSCLAQVLGDQYPGRQRLGVSASRTPRAVARGLTGGGGHQAACWHQCAPLTHVSSCRDANVIL
eukprot:6181930-Pleurochrysis_carterae.AAC.1